MALLSPIPSDAPVVYPEDQILTENWYQWLFEIWLRLNNVPTQAPPAEVTAQSASIGATALAVADGAGVFRVSYAARITQPASVSSSLTISFGWLRNAVVMSLSGGAMTGNTTSTFQSGTFIARIDQSSLNYSTTYVSVGTPMLYELDIVVEKLS